MLLGNELSPGKTHRQQIYNPNTVPKDNNLEISIIDGTQNFFGTTNSSKQKNVCSR